MALDWSEVKNKLATAYNREMVIDIINKSQFPAPIKMFAMLKVSSMDEGELMQYKAPLLSAVSLIEAGNMEGLQEYLTSLSIPEQASGMLIKAINATSNRTQ